LQEVVIPKLSSLLVDP